MDQITFIFGAGISLEYNYPLGRALKNEIVGVCEKREMFASRPGGKVSDLSLLSYSFEENIIKEFSEKLRTSGKKTIDDFLRYHPKFNEIGKFCIALVLLESELQSELHQDDEKFYDYFFNSIYPNPKKVDTNIFRFITYNYDLSLEKYLFDYLTGFNLKSEEVIKKVSDLNITHLHGKLHELEYFDTSGREYGEFEITDELVAKCAKSIKIFTEANPGDLTFDSAHTKIFESDLVYFLGFGYDETNLENLKVSDIIEQKNIRGNNVLFKGTSYNEPENRMNYINEKFFYNRPLIYENSTVKDFLNRDEHFQELVYR